jgi:uncharacterized protein YggL (DUF469 family)
MLGFTVTIAPRDATSPDERRRIVDSLIDALERHDLTGAVRGTGAVEVVVRRDGSQATDADRELVQAWAADWSGRAVIAVGDIVDLTPDA